MNFISYRKQDHESWTYSTETFSLGPPMRLSSEDVIVDKETWQYFFNLIHKSGFDAFLEEKPFRRKRKIGKKDKLVCILKRFGTTQNLKGPSRFGIHNR